MWLSFSPYMLMVCGLVWSLLLWLISYMFQVYLSWPTIPSSIKWWKGHIMPDLLYPVTLWFWTDVLLQYLDSLDNACLNFKLLSRETAILLTIHSGQRMSTIHVFRLSQLQLTTDMDIFNLGTILLKHSRPGRSTPPIVLHCYLHGRWLCPLRNIRDYVTQRTLLAPQIDKFLSLTASPIIRLPRIP